MKIVINIDAGSRIFPKEVKSMLSDTFDDILNSLKMIHKTKKSILYDRNGFIAGTIVIEEDKP